MPPDRKPDPNRPMEPQQVVRLTPRLTDKQLESLRSCAKGISLRFEEPGIVNALVEAGYVEKNIVGVVTVTAKGLQYLEKHGS